MGIQTFDAIAVKELHYGSYISSAITASAGYIKIIDEDGTVRKLVVS